MAAHTSRMVTAGIGSFNAAEVDSLSVPCHHTRTYHPSAPVEEGVASIWGTRCQGTKKFLMFFVVRETLQSMGIPMPGFS